MVTSENSITDSLVDALSPSSDTSTPDSNAMIKFGFEALKASEIGMRLVTVADIEGFNIKIINTPEETVYLPNDKDICIGVCKNPQTSPARFVLLLAKALREAEQKTHGIIDAKLTDDLDKQISVSLSKEGDKIAHICAVAYELDQSNSFTELNLVDEIRNMGYSENMDTFIENVTD